MQIQLNVIKIPRLAALTVELMSSNLIKVGWFIKRHHQTFVSVNRENSISPCTLNFSNRFSSADELCQFPSDGILWIIVQEQKANFYCRKIIQLSFFSRSLFAFCWTEIFIGRHVIKKSAFVWILINSVEYPKRASTGRTF